MLFKSEQTRAFWIGLILKLLFDSIVVIGLVLIFTNNNQLFWILAWLLGIYVFEGLISLYRFTQNLVFGLKYAKDEQLESYIDNFRKHTFPIPDEYHEDILDYLTNTKDNTDLPISTRLEAARSLGAFQQLMFSGPNALKFSTQVNAEKALKRYGRQMRDSNSLNQVESNN